MVSADGRAGGQSGEWSVYESLCLKLLPPISCDKAEIGGILITFNTSSSLFWFDCKTRNSAFLNRISGNNPYWHMRV